MADDRKHYFVDPVDEDQPSPSISPPTTSDIGQNTLHSDLAVSEEDSTSPTSPQSSGCIPKQPSSRVTKKSTTTEPVKTANRWRTFSVSPTNTAETGETNLDLSSPGSYRSHDSNNKLSSPHSAGSILTQDSNPTMEEVTLPELPYGSRFKIQVESPRSQDSTNDIENLPISDYAETTFGVASNTQTLLNQGKRYQQLPQSPPPDIPALPAIEEGNEGTSTVSHNDPSTGSRQPPSTGSQLPSTASRNAANAAPPDVNVLRIERCLYCTIDYKSVCFCLIGIMIGFVLGFTTSHNLASRPGPRDYTYQPLIWAKDEFQDTATGECFTWSTTNITGQPSNKVTNDDLSICAACFWDGATLYDKRSADLTRCGCFYRTMNITTHATPDRLQFITETGSSWCKCYEWALSATNATTGLPIYNVTVASHGCANVALTSHSSGNATPTSNLPIPSSDTPTGYNETSVEEGN